MKKLVLVTAISVSFALFAYDVEEEIADLRQQFVTFSNAITFIERKCETDYKWREAYHQGISATTICTNEFGIIYAVNIYNDGYIYADYKSHTKGTPDPEAEAKAKKEIERRKEEAIAAMQRATLPPKVAEILAKRRAAVNTNTVTVVTEARK